MLKKFHISGFRCFKELELAPLARINLVAGSNDVGKTALLEALFLHSGSTNSDLPLRVNVMRGMERFNLDPIELWGWLFYGKKIDQPIRLTSHDGSGRHHSLKIALADPKNPQPVDSRIALRPESAASTESRAKELSLEYEDSSGVRVETRATVTAQGIEPESKPSPFAKCIFLTTRFRNLAEDATRFSRLALANQHNAIVEPLKTVEPRLRGLSVLSPSGTAMIYADVGMREWMPLPMLGEGVGRLLGILLSIADAPLGLVLVDEIENGIHYSVLEKVWRALDDASRGAGTQVFASSHSLECIRAAQKAFAAGTDEDFKYYRLDRTDGNISATLFTKETLATSVEMNLEVR